MERLNTQVGNAPQKNRRFRYGPTLILVGLALLSIASATLILAAPGSQGAGGVTASPSQVYTGDSIEISLEGFPADFLMPAGSVTLAGVRVPIPGVFATPGVRPKTDSLGNVTFSARVPLDMPVGDQTLAVTHFAGDGERTASVTVLGAVLSFLPSAGSANQAVLLRGAGFNPATNAGGSGPLGAHQITGEGTSGITLNGVLLDAPYVTYPIDLDTDGGLAANLIVPESYLTVPGVSLEVEVVDDGGRSGFAVWPIKSRTITVTPAESGRGGTLTIAGAGFLALRGSITACLPVDLAYAGIKLKQVRPDSSGSFQTTITVPLDVAISSTNTITASIPGCPAAPATTAIHKVPARSVKLVPISSQVGTLVSVNGVSFFGYTTISTMTFGGVSVLPSPMPVLDTDGSFSIQVVVPQLTAGSQTVNITVGGVEFSNNFVVLEIFPTPTPTPTTAPTATTVPTATPTVTPTMFPTPTPTITPTPAPTATPTPAPRPVDSLAQFNGNLLRVWTFDASVGKWYFYDPRSSFTQVNTLPPLAQGQLYWMYVEEDQTLGLNGWQRNLVAGWNLIHW